MKFQPPKGMRDFLPEEAIKFNRLLKVVKSTFEKYGFEPLFSPAVESFELLSAKGGLGEAVKDEIYYFKDKSGREIGLRFDLTMPLARIVSSNPQLPKPFKRYQIERVWRYDNPQALRYREFWQADIDTVGSSSVLADAECLACVCEIFDKLGFKNYYIRVNDRKLIESILGEAKALEKSKEVMRIIDKLAKIGRNKVKDELRSLGVDAEKILNLISIENLDEKSFRGEAKDLFKLLEYAKSFGMEKRLKIDLTLVRGLEYYTGLVFEVFLGADVSCGGGGRYDNLINVVGGQDLPATGISLGLDRILEIMKEKKMLDLPKTRVKVFIAMVNEKVKEDAIKIAQKLREENVSCQIDLMGRSLTKQLEFADGLGIPYVIVVGEKELKEKKFKLKDMKKKTEKSLKLNEIIELVTRNYR
jgi:histidyl-tRNA synthetase